MSKEFQQVVNGSYEPVLPLVQSYKGWRPELSVEIMDPQTYKLIQIDDLYKTVNFTRTRTGAAVLDRSLHQPLTDASLISEKQKSLDELRSDHELRNHVKALVEGAVRDELSLLRYYQREYSTAAMSVPESIYSAYKHSTRLFTRLMQGFEDMAQTDYLKALSKNLSDLRGDEVADFMKGPVFATPFGLKPRKKVGPLMPELQFKATDWKSIRGLLLTLPIALVLGPSFMYPHLLTRELTYLVMMFEMAYVMYPFLLTEMGRKFDDVLYARPLHKRYFQNRNVVNAIETLGKLDELLSLVYYADSLQVPVTLPQMEDSPYHYFEARDLKNPVLVQKNSRYVGNDVDLNGARVTFLTGPNSGGKTSLSKTILQSQVLAQIGSYIPASEARLGVADGIYYHSPMINSLQDEEGRFGVEIQRTRDIFYKTTPKSVVVLDELIEATTYAEKIKHSKVILEGFWDLGGNTILVTHNHELAEDFKRRGGGQFWQVEFNGDHPTHRIMPGISTDSHAGEVLKRIGFTEEDIARHLRNLGLSS